MLYFFYFLESECKMSQPEPQIGENNLKLQMWSVFTSKLSFCRLPAHCDPLEAASIYMSDLSVVVSPRSWS